MKPSSSKTPQTPQTPDKKKEIALTPFSGSSPSRLPIQNRFSPISPTYSQLIQRPVILPPSPTTSSQKDTLVPLGSTRIVSPFKKATSSKSSNSSYVSNSNAQLVKILEEEEVLLYKQSFQKLIEFLFPNESLYIGNKPRNYYEAILIDTGSVNITHIKNPNSNRQIDYSKAQIFQVLSLSDWKAKPFTNKTLSNYPQNPMFNYYDYQDAWYNIFYLRCYSHSWFVFFDKNFDFNHGYPEWMVKWFSHLGNVLETFPLPVKEGFSKFKEIFPQNIPEHEYLLQFTILFKIPWIMAWKFAVKEEESSPMTLHRIVSVKWWDKLPEEQVSNMTVQGVVKYFTGSEGFGVQSTVTPPPSPLPTEDEDEEIRLLMSAPSKEEIRRLLKEIKRSSQNSPTGSATQEIVPSAFQDAQDPYQEFSPYN